MSKDRAPSPLPTVPMEGVDESTWLDVIQKMDEVYTRLIDDEVELEKKNSELEQSQQFIFSVLSAMSDVLIVCDERGLIEQTNAALCELVGNRNVTEFNYRISDAEKAHVFVGLQVNNTAEPAKIAASLRKHGFDTLDLTHDEMAKTHLRHMVGGRSGLAQNELLYRFEFPERPGALMRFLNSMHPDWNISLFHYRNQGADYGQILVGIQVPPGSKKAFREFLDVIGYPNWNETDNPAYKLFL